MQCHITELSKSYIVFEYGIFLSLGYNSHGIICFISSIKINTTLRLSNHFSSSNFNTCTILFNYFSKHHYLPKERCLSNNLFRNKILLFPKPTVILCIQRLWLLFRSILLIGYCNSLQSLFFINMINFININKTIFNKIIVLCLCEKYISIKH